MTTTFSPNDLLLFISNELNPSQAKALGNHLLVDNNLYKEHQQLLELWEQTAQLLIPSNDGMQARILKKLKLETETCEI
jgi:hypothetical protein